MAYLIEIKTRCERPGCTKVATVELYNRVNARMGTYCAPHGQERLRALEKRENEAD